MSLQAYDTNVAFLPLTESLHSQLHVRHVGKVLTSKQVSEAKALFVRQAKFVETDSFLQGYHWQTH